MKPLIAAAVLLSAIPACAKKPAAEVGQSAPDFTAADSRGGAHKLSGHKGKAVVLEWLNYDCPFSRKHYDSKNMQGLQKEYVGRGVVWLSVISSAKGKQGNFPAEKINAMDQERGGAASAILLDSDGTVGKLYGAKTTPHMFVVDAKGVLVYAGAIDDNPSASPSDAAGARNYVREALDAVLAGKPVATSYTKPYGCSVKYR